MAVGVKKSKVQRSKVKMYNEAPGSLIDHEDRTIIQGERL